MKVAFLTNLRAPYRTLQLNEFSAIQDLELNVFYTNDPKTNRNWNITKDINYKEIDLRGIKLFKKNIYLNSGIFNIVKNHELIILGGYEQPSMILTALYCKLMRKPYVLIFDGISVDRLNIKENSIKYKIKKFIINNSFSIMANGSIGKMYFRDIFKYPESRIFNQYLSVDGEKIDSMYCDKSIYRSIYRNKLGIRDKDKVIIYSGRLIDIKNVDSIVRAIKECKVEDIVFLIVGGGILNNYIKTIATQLGVKVIITDFIESQEELFKHYFVGDLLVLPSYVEPWGLVVNEAMHAGLPVVVSENCGCSLDLVIEGKNGYRFNPNNYKDLSNIINKIFLENTIETMGIESKLIIKDWNFANSRKNLIKILNNI